MNQIQNVIKTLGITAGAVQEIREKDGVAVYRVTDGGSSYILKTFENQADRREIRNYHILQTLGLQTLKILGSTHNALLMEDVQQSATLRLCRKDDMENSMVAARLAQWYTQLHERGKAYVAAHGQGLYDETDCITPDNMKAVAAKTGTTASPVWALLHGNFDTIRAKIASIERTLTYNDFYYTNMIVAKDASAAFMFDYNLLGKGYVYADLRNVTSSLGKEAGQAFMQAYGDFDQTEILFDSAASVLTALHFGCQRERFPNWAEEALDQVKNGMLEQAIRRLIAV